MIRTRKPIGIYVALILCLIAASQVIDLFTEQMAPTVDLLTLFVCGVLFGVFLTKLRDRLANKAD